MQLDGILEGPKACTVQVGVSHMEEIEHVKNVVYKNQGLASADWNTEEVDFDKFCVLADENSDAESFLKDPGAGYDRDRPGTRTL